MRALCTLPSALVPLTPSPLLSPLALPSVLPLPLVFHSFPGTLLGSLQYTLHGTFTLPQAGQLVFVSVGRLVRYLHGPHAAPPFVGHMLLDAAVASIPRLFASSPLACACACLRGPHLTCVGTARKIHNTLHGMLPCSFSRSLSLSLALCVPCAPWPFSVRPPSHAHGTQQCTGHPLLPVPRPYLPLRARCIATLGAARLPCCSASSCSGSVPVSLSRPFFFSLPLCARCPLLSPLAVSYPYSLCSAPLWARCTAVCSTLHTPFHGLDTSSSSPWTPGPLLAPSFSSHAPLACFCASLSRPHLPFIGSGQSHCAHDTRHVASYAPLWPLFPLSLPFLVACPLCALCPLAPPCMPSLPCARYTTMYGAPAAPALPLLALVRPRVQAMFLLPLPPPVRARCRALCMASTPPLFAPLRRLCPLGPSVLPALARS